MHKRSQKVIVSGDTPNKHDIKGANSPIIQKLSFGFNFFREDKLFGLKAVGKKIDNQWFISLVNQLQILGTYTRDQIQESPKLSHQFRHHKLNYSIPNIPINPSHFSWLPKEYYENDEFSIWQFQVSKANGRFLGFYDENNVFQIIHFDPLHNAQPSEDFDYKVDNCLPIGTVYERLVTHLEEQHAVCSSCCQNEQDEMLLSILEEHRTPNSTFCVIHIEQTLYKEYLSLKKAYSTTHQEALLPSEVFKMGIFEAGKIIGSVP